LLSDARILHPGQRVMYRGVCEAIHTCREYAPEFSVAITNPANDSLNLFGIQGEHSLSKFAEQFSGKCG
jgi:hypothetical protein